MTAYQRVPNAPYTPVRHVAAGPARPNAFVEIAWIDHRGLPAWDRRALPDTPEMEDAVSGFARGTMLRGPSGPVAVEDLVPGDHVAVRGGGTARVDWIGARSYPSGARRPTFYRVAAHAFGASGPDTDVLLGATAHVLLHSARNVPLVGGPLAFAPVSAFADGHRVAAVTPPGEVTVYGLACRGQEAVLAGGLAVESYHPARATRCRLTRTVLADMAQLLPQTAGGAGFGAPRVPHLTASEAAGLALSGI